MNQKQFITLLVLGLLVGGLGYYFYNQRKESYGSSYFESGQRVLPEFPINEVAHIRIKTATNEVNLVRGEENAWTVQERWDYPADYADVSSFLRTVWQLEPVQDVPAGPSQYGRLDLVSPGEGSTNTATLVEFQDGKGGDLKSLLLGKQHTRESAGSPLGGGGSFPVGRYVLVPGSGDVWLVSETFSSVSTDPEEWLSKDFIRVEKAKSISVMRPGSETNSWHVVRETESGQWQLANPRPGENFDPAKASSLNFAFASATFEDVASPELSPEQTGLDQPVTATLETFDGFVYTVQVGNETNDTYYVKVDVQAELPTERTPPAEEKPEEKETADKAFQENLEKLREKLENEQLHARWTYLVSKYTVDSLLKNRGDFMAEPEQDAPEQTSTESGASADESTAGLAPDLNFLPPELQNLPAAATSNIPAESSSANEDEAATAEAEEPATPEASGAGEQPEEQSATPTP